MEYIILFLSALVIAQIIKFLFRLFSNTQDSKNFFWVFVYSTGAPSAHTAVLTSSLVLLNKDIGFSPIFYFACIVSVIFMYNLVADRKREIIRDSNQKVLDISGHSVFDIFTGFGLGIIIGLIFVFYF